MAASEEQNRLDRERDQDSELEQYGVWVKAGPEDVDESDAEDEMFTLTDLDETELDEAEMDLLDGYGEPEPEPVVSDSSEDELSLDDLSLDDDLTLEEPTAPEASPEDEIDLATEEDHRSPASDESVPVQPAHERAETANVDTDDDTEDLLTLEDDDFVLDLDEETDELGVESNLDLTEPEPLPAEPLDGEDTSELDELELEPDELDLDELDLDELELEPDDTSGSSADSGTTADESTDELELESIGADEDDERTSGSGIDIDDELPGNLDDLTLDLDSLDVDAFAEPITGEQVDDREEVDTEVDTADELDVEIEASAEELQLGTEELNLEEDELDLSVLDLDDDTEVAELDLSTLPDDDDEFASVTPDSTDQDAEELPELELDDELSDELSNDESDSIELADDFDDVQAVEDEMSAPTHDDLGDVLDEYETVDLDSLAQEPAPPSDEGRATSLLASIERELSSIRSELSDLKRELATLRSEPRSPVEGSTLAEEADEAAGGFFEDEGDDDETIALTGDELDNIMNTAEFTEEAGQPTDYDEVVPQPAGPDVGEPDTATHPVQEITLEEAPEDADDIDLDLTGLNEHESEPDDSDDVFGGSEDDVEALAELDIDAELADIEELDDGSSSGETHRSPEASEEEADDVPELEIDTLQPDTNLAGIDSPEEEEEPLAALDLDEEPSLPEEPPVDLGDQMEQLDQIGDAPIPENIKGELRSVLNYMDKLLDSLPEEKIQEFAASEHFKVYKRLFEELGLEQ